MKKLFYILPLALLLTACPMALDFAPGYIGKEKVNTNLEGTWKFNSADTSSDAEVMQVTFKKKDKYSFDITVDEKGEMYSREGITYTGYETEIDDLQVLYFKPSDEDKYYLYQYQLKNNELIIADIPLLDGGIDVVTSIETLRDQIKASKDKDDFYKDIKTYSRVKI